MELNLRMQQALAEGDRSQLAALESATDTALAAALAASRARRSAMGATQDSLDAVKAEADAVATDLATRKKSLDLAFLVDCTYSMAHHIAEMLQHVQEIFSAATDIHTDAIVRVAFVGYRDITNRKRQSSHRMSILDFTDDAAGFRCFMANNVSADGRETLNLDNRCEDIAGGLQKVVELSWRSSSRVLIHIADYPAHGRQYHDYSSDDQDAFMDGNPFGLVPEQLVQELAALKVDYNFGEITEDTRKMTAIFAKAYTGCQAKFTVRNARNPAADFVPLVLNSVSSSMSRAQFLRKIESAAAEAAAKLTRADEQPSFLTPPLR